MSAISAASDSDDDEDSRDMSGKVLTKAGVEIDRSSAGNVKRTREEVAADEEQEDEFGYTTSKTLVVLCCRFNSLVCFHREN